MHECSFCVHLPEWLKHCAEENCSNVGGVVKHRYALLRGLAHQHTLDPTRDVVQEFQVARSCLQNLETFERLKRTDGSACKVSLKTNHFKRKLAVGGMLGGVHFERKRGTVLSGIHNGVSDLLFNVSQLSFFPLFVFSHCFQVVEGRRTVLAGWVGHQTVFVVLHEDSFPSTGVHKWIVESNLGFGDEFVEIRLVGLRVNGVVVKVVTQGLVVDQRHHGSMFQFLQSEDGSVGLDDGGLEIYRRHQDRAVTTVFPIVTGQPLENAQADPAPSSPIQREAELETLEVVHRLNHLSELLQSLV